MGDKRQAAIQKICSRFFRDGLDDVAKGLLERYIDEEMGEQGIRPEWLIPWLRCPRCHRPMKRSKLGWVVACFMSSGGCGFKPP